MIGEVVKRRQLVGVMSSRTGWTACASWFTPRLAFWPTDGREYPSDLFDFSFLSSSSLRLFSQLSDRPSSQFSASTCIKKKKALRRKLEVCSPFFPPPLFHALIGTLPILGLYPWLQVVHFLYVFAVFLFSLCYPLSFHPTSHHPLLRQFVNELMIMARS